MQKKTKQNKKTKQKQKAKKKKPPKQIMAFLYHMNSKLKAAL